MCTSVKFINVKVNGVNLTLSKVSSLFEIIAISKMPADNAFEVKNMGPILIHKHDYNNELDDKINILK